MHCNASPVILFRLGLGVPVSSSKVGSFRTPNLAWLRCIQSLLEWIFMAEQLRLSPKVKHGVGLGGDMFSALQTSFSGVAGCLESRTHQTTLCSSQRNSECFSIPSVFYAPNFGGGTNWWRPLPPRLCTKAQRSTEMWRNLIGRHRILTTTDPNTPGMS